MGRRTGRRRGRSRRVGLLLLLVLLLGLGAYALAQGVGIPSGLTTPERPRGDGEPPVGDVGVLRVHYVDVGQGDGTIWELPDGSVVVYDCGPPVREDVVNPMVRYLRDELGRAPGSRIAALVSSHGHLDHIGGCEEIFSSYAVERVYETWYEGDDAPESYRRFQAEVEAEGAVLHKLPELAIGTQLAVPGVDARVLWPSAFRSGGWDRIAEASLVVRVKHGAASFCFQGDIEEAQEGELAGACDVYLVGHHGSRYASGAEWLARMDPEIAVVSYGENEYGHPHPEAMCRIAATGATIYATEGQGAIVVESDGRSARVVRGVPVTMGAACAQDP